MEPFLIQPTIIYDYPTVVSPLSKQKPDDPEHVERFEFFCGGFELGNAFSELNDPVEQHKRFADQLAQRAAATTKRTRWTRIMCGRWPMACLHRWRRHRDRPAGDAADRIKVDSGCNSVSADEKQGSGTGIRDQRSLQRWRVWRPGARNCEVSGTFRPRETRHR